jgi:murein DD-endopeptidase
MKLHRPVPKDIPITSPFGAVGDTPLRTKPHGGVDFGCPLNTPLEACFDGTVVSVYKACQKPERNWQFGNWLVLVGYKTGTYAIYAHLNGFLVKQGEKVAKGHTIALSGNSGNSTGPHLHFQLQRLADNEKIAPVFEEDGGETETSPAV